MKLVHLCALALPAAALTFACSSGSSSSGSSAAAETALRGAYVPVGDSTTTAEFRALVFTSSTAYFSYKNNCTGSDCRQQGTYTFDGKTDLELSPEGGKVEHVDFKAIQVDSQPISLIGSVIGESHPLDAPLVTGTNSGLVNTMGSSGLVNMSSGSLVSGDGGSLLSQILQALVNGAMMALMGSMNMGDDDDDAGSSSSGLFCDSNNAAADCFAQGGTSVAMNADGSCSCTTGDAGAAAPAPDAAPTTVTITLPDGGTVTGTIAPAGGT